PRSPWQRAYIERVIGSLRRECLDHMIVFHETSLRRTLTSYFDYYHRWRTHLSLEKDAPEPRAIHPPEMGSVVALPLVGGLHHRYERRSAWTSQNQTLPVLAFRLSSPKSARARAHHSEFGSPDSMRVHKPIDLCGSSGRIPSTLGLLRISGRHNMRSVPAAPG